MIDPAEALDAVQTDVETALARQVRATDGFRVRDDIGGTADDPLTNADATVVVVPWEWSGTNAGLFGLDPTNRAVTVRGVTIVTEGENGLLLHRSVDWLEVMAQAGIAVNTRPIVDIRDGYDEDSLRAVPELAEAFDLADTMHRAPGDRAD